ncbi:TRAP transporter substrate-binding protein [Sinirhodobacter populi]|uniref:TRAP transporter substrate-binding protein n=2 Tax=Paenirhodobacter populi TaxID=2306993 RepID=A0A443J4X9_9RHOB|nr:TRAP transporter substrate-binding protein [Sinirhodobacter populi]
MYPDDGTCRSAGQPRPARRGGAGGAETRNTEVLWLVLMTPSRGWEEETMKYGTLGMIAAAISLSAAQAMAVELTAAHVNPPGEPSNIAFQELAKRLNAGETGITLQVFPQGQIGGETDALEQVRFGALSMTTVANASLSSFAPSAGVFDLPYLFRDGDTHPWIVVDGEIGKDIEARIEAETGMEVLGWWSGGLRHVFTRNSPVTTPADMSGRKLRVIGSQVYLDSFNAMGALATAMPYGEVYTSLATGAIDGAENDTSGYRNVKFYEQAPNLSLTGHFFLFKPVLANRREMDRLSPEQRAEFDRIFAEVTAMQRDLFRSNFESDIEWLKANGVNVVEVDRTAFAEKVQPVVEKLSATFGTDLVQRIRDAQ